MIHFFKSFFNKKCEFKLQKICTNYPNFCARLDNMHKKLDN